MAFESIPPVPTADELLDMAFGGAEKESRNARKTLTAKSRLRKSVILESIKVKTVGDVLITHLSSALKSFPSLEGISPFYYDLIVCTIDYVDAKQSLGALKWAGTKIGKLTSDYHHRIRFCEDLKAINSLRQAYYGRISSVVKQISRNLKVLEADRKVFRKYPTIKTSIYTVVIAGYPNVGKSTLLKAMTGSEPEIAPYPFTTKRIMIGYMEKAKTKVQVIDTPGLLDRPLADRNNIERQAILALTHLADMVVFVVDPSEHCGYLMKQQMDLLRDMRKEFSEITVVANKTDIKKTDKENMMLISAKENVGIDELKKLIFVDADKTKKADDAEERNKTKKDNTDAEEINYDIDEDNDDLN